MGKVGESKDKVILLTIKKLFFPIKKTSHELKKILNVSYDNTEIEKKIQKEIYTRYKKVEEQRLSEHKINKKRIYDFLERNFSKVPQNILFVNNEDIKIIKKICNKFNYVDNAPTFESNEYGKYYPVIDVAFVNLDNKDWPKKTQDEAIQKESTAVHELIHQMRGKYITLQTKEGNYVSRSGMAVRNIESGKEFLAFLEEGFVRYMQKEYEAEYLPDEYKEPGVLSLEGEYSFVPPFWVRPLNGKISFSLQNFSGMALELLLKESPGLFECFLKIRNENNTKNYQEIRKLIDEFKMPPNDFNGNKKQRSLYGELRNLGRTDTDSEKGYYLVKEAIEYTKNH